MKKRTFAKELEELIEIFIAENYKKSSIGQQNSRLRRCIGIFQEHGITSPTVDDFEILRAEITSAPEKYTSVAREFYNWVEMRGDNKMKENESRSTEAQQGIIDGEQVEQQQAAPSINQQATEPRAGRPVSTGRSEKISLYITKETAKKIEALRIFYDIDLQDLLNEAIQVYFDTQKNILEFLQEQEQARVELRARLARNTN